MILQIQPPCCSHQNVSGYPSHSLSNHTWPINSFRNIQEVTFSHHLPAWCMKPSSLFGITVIASTLVLLPYTSFSQQSSQSDKIKQSQLCNSSAQRTKEVLLLLRMIFTFQKAWWPLWPWLSEFTVLYSTPLLPKDFLFVLWTHQAFFFSTNFCSYSIETLSFMTCSLLSGICSNVLFWMRPSLTILLKITSLFLSQHQLSFLLASFFNHLSTVCLLFCLISACPLEFKDHKIMDYYCLFSWVLYFQLLGIIFAL